MLRLSEINHVDMKTPDDLMNAHTVQIDVHDRASLVRRGRRLEYFTIGYNSLEGLIALVAGLMAGSIALVGFGFDSLIEVTSGSALLWRLHLDADEARRERVEAVTLRIVGVLFLLLAAYVSYDSIKSLIWRERPRESIPGIILAIASVIVMPLLVRAKRKVARGIKSAALMADSKQTELCTYLSAILLAGLLLNAFFGWWWADPVAALIMVPIIVKEGIEGLRGENCCDDGCGPTGG
jgi:divalent metal cation (Fe/Co/Zn/Cd) transporter